MDQKKISRFLILLGIVLIGFGFTMDTSVSSGFGRVHNVGLVAQQQNLLIIGGIAFLAGIIIFSSNHKSNSTSITETLSKPVGDDHLNQDFRNISSMFVENLNKWVVAKRDNKLGRFLIFLYTLPFSIALGMVFDDESPLSVMPFFVLLLWVLSPYSGKRVILSLLYTHIASAILCIAIITSERGPMLLVCILIVLTAINYLIARYLKRKESSEIVSQK